MAIPIYQVGDVFVPGGQPTVTYIPRSNLKLEPAVRDYLSERRKILSLAGPTKSGKSVLLKSMLAGRRLVWLPGGQLDSLKTFWEQVADELGVETELGRARGEQESKSRTTQGGASIKPLGTGIDAGTASTTAKTVSRTDSGGRKRSLSRAASQGLIDSGAVLVIDDFHYIEHDVQLGIVRGLKEMVFEGLPVIFAAVPHRAYDVVRAEKEMTGRVELLEIPFWTPDELAGIAAEGFKALNVTDHDNVAPRLVDESFKSPHLMQQFCLSLCKENDVHQTEGVAKALLKPADWDAFFKRYCKIASKLEFEELASGPKRSSGRLERNLTDGTTTDIYGAVLRAIASTGPTAKISYEELRDGMRTVMSGELPQRHEVSRVLEQMSKIARARVKGGSEPVVDYVQEPVPTLHITDPFFAYYLRWCIDYHSESS